MKLTIRPLTADLWPALEDLFGRNGACDGCWCMYWRIGSLYRKRPRQKNKAAFREIVKQGPPPGLLAFDGDLAVGWCQLTPRDDLPWLDRTTRLERVDAAPVWSLSCFYVRRGYRRKGVTSALIAAAVKSAKHASAPALEAYPLDAEETPSASFTGFASTLTRAGFKTVARRVPTRPIMRRHLEVAPKTELWRCPKCGERFTTRNQRHSCGSFDLDALFARSRPPVRRLYDRFVAIAREHGPVTVIPQKTRIALQVRMRFAALMPQKSALKGHLVLSRRHPSARFEKIETYSPRNHVHVFRLRGDDELDAGFRRLIGEAYRVGRQDHVSK